MATDSTGAKYCRYGDGLGLNEAETDDEAVIDCVAVADAVMEAVDVTVGVTDGLLLGDGKTRSLTGGLRTSTPTAPFPS